MNIDFSLEPLFSWYVVLLIVSGIAMTGIGAMGNSGLSNGWRIFNGVAGVGFVGYGIYLGFIFEGGTYVIFFKAFILPVVMIINFVRSLSNRNQAAAQPPVQFQQPFPQPEAPQAPVPAQAQAPAQAQPQAPAQPAEAGGANQAG
ncbi:hypothetical protein ACGFX4_08800 [Kitasatospora sp. NPDC048365]|uniref:hypothetical protein n=1 Tax=Kitasatospora sp. NPDC048365 TaxID=3364050 RepID=UPI003715AE01